MGKIEQIYSAWGADCKSLFVRFPISDCILHDVVPQGRTAYATGNVRAMDQDSQGGQLIESKLSSRTEGGFSAADALRKARAGAVTGHVAPAVEATSDDRLDTVASRVQDLYDKIRKDPDSTRASSVTLLKKETARDMSNETEAHFSPPVSSPS